MRAIGKFVRNNDSIKRQLEQCDCTQHQLPQEQQWQSCLSKRGEDLIEMSCCSKVVHSYLSYGVGSSKCTPKLLQWKCVNNECSGCSVEAKLKMTTYTILSECKHVIDVVEWVQTPRQGKKNNGQQNTQLELGTSKLKVGDVVYVVTDRQGHATGCRANFQGAPLG